MRLPVWTAGIWRNDQHDWTPGQGGDEKGGGGLQQKRSETVEERDPFCSVLGSPIPPPNDGITTALETWLCLDHRRPLEVAAAVAPLVMVGVG